MSLSRYQLERTDVTEIEQGRRVWLEQDVENHRGMNTLGDLLFVRHFIGRNAALRQARRDAYTPKPAPATEPNPHKFPCQDPYCDRCNDAIKRLFKDIGLLPSGKPPWGDLTDEPFSGRLMVPSRYRKDESDR